ncbi:MAG: hypothetical protein II006_03315 [Peptostreptococcaceae bacterium]|nr:hypothetical protein [Peptostreptococcaceae bacterium]
MNGKIRESSVLQAPFIKVISKITMPGTTNGIPNIKNEEKYVVAPSAKKIATYIRNQLFGSDLMTQTDGLDINWIMPALGTALENAVYCKESFIYIHKFDNKVYLECLKKNELFNLVQKYDKVISFDIIQDYDTEDTRYSLERHVDQKDDGTSVITMRAFEKTKGRKEEWINIELSRFNKITGSDYKRLYNLPYHPLINIDIGQEFFKDSEKFLNEEMKIFNTFAEEIDKTKTRIVTSQHYQTGDIASNWQPRANMYEVQTLQVNNLQDYFTLLPGDKEHQIFEFLQGDIRVQQYIDSFKFCDYQIIQMANLSPATFGYEKDSYQNVASIDLNANLTEMTIEAIKKQIEPQVNNLIVNIIKLQQALNIKENAIPETLVWDYGDNERLDDMKKLQVLGAVLRTMSVPYSVRSKITAPILNKLIDEDIEPEVLFTDWKKEKDDIEIDYAEI